METWTKMDIMNNISYNATFRRIFICTYVTNLILVPHFLSVLFHSLTLLSFQILTLPAVTPVFPLLSITHLLTCSDHLVCFQPDLCLILTWISLTFNSICRLSELFWCPDPVILSRCGYVNDNLSYNYWCVLHQYTSSYIFTI